MVVSWSQVMQSVKKTWVTEEIKKTWADLEKVLIPTLVKTDVTKLNHTQLQLFSWLQKTPMPYQWIAWQGICIVEYLGKSPKLNETEARNITRMGLESVWHGVSCLAIEEKYSLTQLINKWKEPMTFAYFAQSISNNNSLLCNYLSQYFTDTTRPELILSSMRLGVLRGYDSCFSVAEPKTAIQQLNKFIRSNHWEVKKLGLNRLSKNIDKSYIQHKQQKTLLISSSNNTTITSYPTNNEENEK